MARLPNPGGDDNQWGEILNTYLSVSHASDGTLKDDSVTTSTIADGAITNPKLASNSVDTAQLVDNSVTSAKIASGGLGPASVTGTALVNSQLGAANGVASLGSGGKIPAGQIPDLSASYVTLGSLYVTPEAYGAVGDGATDDTSALQAAIDAASTNNVGVLLSAKTYLHSTLTVPGNIRIQGSGVGQTRLKAKAGLTDHQIKTSTWSANYAQGNTNVGDWNISFADFTIDGNRANQSSPLATTGPAPTLGTTTGGSLVPAQYGYRVAAKNAFGISNASSIVRITTGSTGSVTLSWSAVSGATGYVIYGRDPFLQYTLAVVGNVTSWTDTGANTPNTNALISLGNCTAPAGMAIYGAGMHYNNIEIVNAAGIGLITEWVDGGGGVYPGASMESHLADVVIYGSGTSSYYHRGPHDSLAVNCIFAMPSMINAAAEDNVVVQVGPVHAVNCHAWGQGRWAFNLVCESSLKGCQAEGGRTGQILLYSTAIKVEGGTVFFPGSASAVGIKVGDSGYAPGNCTIGDVLFYGFSSSSGVALDLSDASNGDLSVQATIVQSSGTRYSVKSGVAYNRLSLSQLGTATVVPVTSVVGAQFAKTITSDQTTTSTSIGDISGLMFTVQPGEYVIDLNGAYTSSLTTAGPRFAVGGTATASAVFGELTMNLSTTTFYTGFLGSMGGTNGANPGTANTNFLVRGRVRVVVNAAGTLGWQWLVSSAATGTLRTGANATLTRVS